MKSLKGEIANPLNTTEGGENMTSNLPRCVSARRIGYWSEGEYDLDGELAPITWACACGYRLQLEELVGDRYIPVSESVKTDFIARHSNCTGKCWNCGTVAVGSFGDWCEECQD